MNAKAFQINNDYRFKIYSMQHIFLFLIFFLSIKISKAQNEFQDSPKTFGADTILWQQDSLLSNEDFKGKPAGSFQGLTFSGIFLDMKHEERLLRVYCYTLFICKKSFLKDSSDNLLNHEQLHFDITELYARKIRQQLSQKLILDDKNISAAIQKIYNTQIAELNKEQDRYDKETEHGTNQTKQILWKESIRKQIDLFYDYAEIEIRID